MAATFLLDQMFDRAVLAGLRDAGFDVVAVSEFGMATADDAEIMQWAVANQRVVITLDDHFGDWAILPLHAHSGVIHPVEGKPDYHGQRYESAEAILEPSFLQRFHQSSCYCP